MINRQRMLDIADKYQFKDQTLGKYSDTLDSLQKELRELDERRYRERKMIFESSTITEDEINEQAFDFVKKELTSRLNNLKWYELSKKFTIYKALDILKRNPSSAHYYKISLLPRIGTAVPDAVTVANFVRSKEK